MMVVSCELHHGAPEGLLLVALQHCSSDTQRNVWGGWKSSLRLKLVFLRNLGTLDIVRYHGKESTRVTQLLKFNLRPEFHLAASVSGS